MKPTRVSIAYVQGGYLREYEKAFVPLFSEELRKNGGERGLVLEENPSRADIIILWEGFETKTVDYINVLENDPLVRNHADRVYAINYEDHPDGLLAGLYTSLEHPFFNSAIHRIWPFFQMNNSMVYELTRDQVEISNPSRLFSFAGAASHDVRKRLFEIYSKASPDYFIAHIKKWYNHNDDERRNFLNIALDSWFCLCPHGYCSYTPRITEVMAMGRAPVIIADDWIPLSFEDDIPYYIKVAERDIERLPEILSARRKDAKEYGHNARILWEKYCSMPNRAVTPVQCLAKLAARPGDRMSYSQYRELWHSKEFLSRAGWTFRQRLALRVEQHVRRRIPAARIPGVSPLMRYRSAPGPK